MSTPYERGYAAGQWTKKKIRDLGFRSATECLAHQEKVHQDECAALPHLYQRNPTFAAQQEEYLNGLIAGTRVSLRGL